MCYQYGSVAHYTAVCPMCKVFKPSGAKCPHKKEICTNSANHVKDIVFLKNAEVQTFNGCGYCKWARANTGKLNPYQNPGWAGCCRPPKESERIPPADWPAVSTVHGIPMPPEVKAMLESATSTPRPPAVVPSSLSKAPATPPSLDRRTSPATLPTRANISPRTQPLSIPSKVRSNGSPKEASAQLGNVTTPKGSALKESPPEGSIHRRSVDQSVPRGESPNTPSPLRRHIELEGSIVRSTDRRSSVSRITSKGSPESISTPSLRRRASTVDAGGRASASGSAERRAPDRTNTISSTRPSIKRSSLDIDFSGLSLDSSIASQPSPLSPGSASSDGGNDARSVSGSSSDGTVTSDGGFTDYLSDESEAELQRQAEARAALLAQNQMEDLEFKAARKQLAHVGLRPPKSWNAGGGRAQTVEAVGGYGRGR